MYRDTRILLYDCLLCPFFNGARRGILRERFVFTTCYKIGSVPSQHIASVALARIEIKSDNFIRWRITRFASTFTFFWKSFIFWERGRRQRVNFFFLTLVTRAVGIFCRHVTVVGAWCCQTK